MKILVANRGEIARRIMRTCRRMGIATVAVYSTADRDALFVAEADEAIPLDGASPAASYLRADAIVAAARITGAHAIHPGYGFLAEDAAFATAVEAAGITWIGPGPAAISAMGDKIGAIRHMADAGIPVLPHAVVDGADATEAGARIGFPLLVKAARGGGGTGMRHVATPADLEGALVAAGREAASAFGDGTLYLERALDRPRHIEVQIFGDATGRVIHLWERDCSVQRRHQKVVEEAPAPDLDPNLRRLLLDAAVGAASSVGYVGAGTVEFLVDGTDGWFLEMNTRLQVEHPVTEAVLDLDLVALQIETALGAALPPQDAIGAPRGHAVEARLYAEDPADDYLPQAGTVSRFAVSDDVRVDSAISSAGPVPHHYDALIAKIIAHGTDREEAYRRLHRALVGSEVHGITTNRDLLVAITAHPDVAAGPVDTGWLDRTGATAILTPPDDDVLRLHAAAAALACRARDHAAGRHPEVPADWRNLPAGPVIRRFGGHETTLSVAVREHRTSTEIDVDDSAVEGLEVLSATADRVDMVAGGVRRTYRVHLDGGTVWVDSPLGSTTLAEIPRFAVADTDGDLGSLAAPMPATVVAVQASVGDRVAAGDPIMVLEAMKMEHTVTTPAAGRLVEIRAGIGDQVAAGTILAVVAED